MTDHIWIGGAPEVAQVVTVTVPDDIEAGMVIEATIGLKKLSYTVLSGATATSVAAAFVALWNASTVPHFAEITAAAGATAGTFTLTADEEGVPFVVTFTMGGETNEIQVVTIGNSPTGGTFTLAFEGQVTAGIAYNAAASAVESALEALTTIGGGNVSVTGSDGGPWTVEFIGDLVGENVTEMGANPDNLTVAAEVQLIDLGNPTGGTFTVQIGEDGTPSAAIAYNASAATLKTALETLAGIAVDDIAVSGSDGGPYTLTFQNNLAGVNAEQIIVNGSSLTGGLADAVTITEQTAGGGGANEIWNIRETYGTEGYMSIAGNSSVSSGTFDLTIAIAGSDVLTLTGVQYDVTAYELQLLIDADLSAANANGIFVSSTSGANQLSEGDSFFFFISPTLGAGALTATVNSAGLTGGSYSRSIIDSPADGSGGRDESSFFVVINGEASSQLAYNASAVDIQTAAEALSSVGSGNISIEHISDGATIAHGIRLTFIGDLGNQITGLSVTILTSGDDYSVQRNLPGVTGISEVQQISITGSPGAGEFSVKLGTGFSGPIAYNQTASELEDILEAVSTIGTGNVSCSGGPFPDTAIDVTFTGGLSGTDVTLMSEVQGYSETTVQGGESATVTVNTTQIPIESTTTTANSGPNLWDVAANWNTNTVPVNSDNVFIVDGDNILYGLDQSAVTLGRLEIGNKEVEIGLPRRNVDTIEYRETFLKIGAATIVTGLGAGNGSDRIQIDFGGTDPAITVHASGRGDDEPAVQFTSTNATNTASLEILGGEVGVAVYPDQEAHFASITQRSGDLTIGSDVTLLGLERTGGSISIDEATITGTISL